MSAIVVRAAFSGVTSDRRVPRSAHRWNEARMFSKVKA
jgi:hypothetical protein